MTNTSSSMMILRRQQVQAQSGLPRSTMYLRVTQGLWTRPVSLGARSVGWPASEVDALNTARIAGKTDEQIRQLVKQLEASRSAPERQGNQLAGNAGREGA